MEFGDENSLCLSNSQFCDNWPFVVAMAWRHRCHSLWSTNEKQRQQLNRRRTISSAFQVHFQCNISIPLSSIDLLLCPASSWYRKLFTKSFSDCAQLSVCVYEHASTLQMKWWNIFWIENRWDLKWSQRTLNAVITCARTHIDIFSRKMAKMKQFYGCSCHCRRSQIHVVRRKLFRCTQERRRKKMRNRTIEKRQKAKISVNKFRQTLNSGQKRDSSAHTQSRVHKGTPRRWKNFIILLCMRKCVL